MPGEETSIASYQNFDGSNTSILLRSTAYKPSKNTTLTASFGGSTNFKGTNSFVLEGKAKYALSNDFSLNARLRNSINFQNSTSQLRLSGDYGVKVSDDVSIYADPYVAVKYGCKTRKFDVDEGIFVGAKYKVNDGMYIAGEVQKYNGFEGGAGNWGVNVIFSHPF